MSKVCVIILNWNGYDDTVACTYSVLGVSHRDCDILLVDNGSDNDEAKRLGALFAQEPRVQIVSNEKNLGYCGGNNSAVRYIREKGLAYDFCVVLNNDTEVDPHFVTKLLDGFAEDASRAIVGATILSYFDHALVDTKGLDYSLWTGAAFSQDHGKPFVRDDYQPFAASGACFMIKTEALDDIQYLFDEDFFCYFEEVELAVRLRKKGYTIGMRQDAFVYHKESVSSNRISGFGEFQLIRNRFLVVAKQGSFLQKISYILLTTCFYFWLRMAILVRHQSWSAMRHFLRGYVAGLSYFFFRKLVRFAR